MVRLRARIGLPQRRQRQRQHLKHLHTRARHGKCKDIFSGLQRVALRQPGDIGRIVEAALALCLDQARIILAETLKARAANRRGMRLPVGGGELAVTITAYGDAAVDDRDQMSVGDQVQDIAAPGTIDAGEQDVAIEAARNPSSSYIAATIFSTLKGSAVARVSRCAACTWRICPTDDCRSKSGNITCRRTHGREASNSGKDHHQNPVVNIRLSNFLLILA